MNCLWRFRVAEDGTTRDWLDLRTAGKSKGNEMSWTESEQLRRPQGICECPERFRGSSRYISEAETRLPTRLPFGKHKNQLIESVPTSYLEWFVGIDMGDDLKTAVRNELSKRKESRHGRTASHNR